MVYRKTPDVLENLATKREQIRDAAMKLMVSRAGALDVRDIAEQAGVGVGTIYTHWPDMRELAAAAVARRLQLDLERMDRAASAATKPIAAAAAAFAVYVGRARKCRGLATITADATYRNGIVRAFESRIAEAQLKVAPELAAIAIYGALNAALASRVRLEGSPDLASTLVLMALQMMGVAPWREAAGFTAAGMTLAEVMP